MPSTHEMDNIQYDLTHIKTLLHQQLVMVCCGGEGRSNFFFSHCCGENKSFGTVKNHFCWDLACKILTRGACCVVVYFFFALSLAALHPPLNSSQTNNLKKYSVWLCLYGGFCHHARRNINFSFRVATVCFLFFFLKEKKRNSCICWA